MEGTKESPFISKVLKRERLSKTGSSKNTFHIELLGSSNLEYEPGDSIGVFPYYPVDRIAPLMEKYFQGIERLEFRSESYSILELLTSKVNLDTFSKKFLRTLASLEIENRPLMDQLLEDKEACKAFIHDHIVESALMLFKPQFTNAGIDHQSLIDSLSPTLPRMYSIASSKLEHPEEIHLTVGTFSFEKQGHRCVGLGSNFLCYQAEVGATDIPLYIHRSPHFKLPPGGDEHIIMVGPGTGIAPYRAFLQERRAQKTEGRHWLFFGNRNQKTDFYYEDFLDEFSQTHSLKLDLAFSRDQPEKIYVQHKMEEKSREIWQWLEEGAHLYICGDARQMAKDVQEALQAIAQKEGGYSEEESKELLKRLRKEKKLLMDVY